MVSGLERKYVGLLRTEKQILNDSKNAVRFLQMVYWFLFWEDFEFDASTPFP